VLPFVDEMMVTLSSGAGGAGRVSFRREKFLPRGGPDGGDGGRGGDLHLVARASLTTFDSIGGRRFFHAGKGQPGGPNERHGRQGKDLWVELPPGTIMRDAERGHVLLELLTVDENVLFLHGGRGGRGNASFRGPTKQAPRTAQPGEDGQTRKVILELKLLAEVGIVGLPNAGKSTLLARITKARPKIADYPFTTLGPKIGVVHHEFETLTIADLPGLLEGAHLGKGLGTRFLRHVERTRLLVHLIDCSEGEVESWRQRHRVIRAELEAAGEGLAEKDEIIVLSKVDLRGDLPPRVEIESILGRPVLVVSARENLGLEELVDTLFKLVRAARAQAARAH